MKNKLQRIWREHKEEIVLGTVFASLIGLGIGIYVYSGRTLNKLRTAPTVSITDGPLIKVQMGGEKSPFIYEITEDAFEAYNRVGKAFEHTVGPLLIADDQDMRVWNSVANLTNTYLKEHDPVDSDLVTDHYLRRI